MFFRTSMWPSVPRIVRRVSPQCAFVGDLRRSRIVARKLGRELRLSSVERDEVGAGSDDRVHHSVDVRVVHADDTSSNTRGGATFLGHGVYAR